jgi:7,8-dihydropterin-6-yl-methyl-4-(beta-D-ribofuranosyl)aminobenzene 5'-phosphate synthase
MPAEHDFSAPARVRRAGRVTTLLFDSGLSPDAMVTNAARLGISPLSRAASSSATPTSTTRRACRCPRCPVAADGGAPVVVHPQVWTKHRPGTVIARVVRPHGADRAPPA